MIRFACTCGEQLHVPDELAGQGTFCTVCGRKQFVAGGGDDEPFNRAPATSTGAILSLALGVASFFCTWFAGIPAIILGFVSLIKIIECRGRRSIGALAVAGIMTGVIGSLTRWETFNTVCILPAPPPRTQSANNLRQMALALNTYSVDNDRRFPPAAGGKGMHPNLSWRVAILPYMEEDELYNQFHLDEPWDSPHNAHLLHRMPRTYVLPGVDDPPGMTRYRVFVGKQAAFELSDPGARAPLGRRYFEDFPNGTSKTIFVAEAADPVPWTKPDELVFDPDQPMPRLSDRPGGCQVAMGDASIHTLPASITEDELRALIDRDGQK